MSLIKLKKELKNLADPVQAKNLQRFFKTGPGEYGEGDIFLGIKVPMQRQIAKQYASIGLKDIEVIIKSNIHEHRLVAILILIEQFQKGDEKTKKRIFDFYLEHTEYINNWDLVDLSAHKIVGAYLRDKPRNILYKLARSKNLWERRISIISCFYFISNNDFGDAVKIAGILLKDEQDLIHKAVGWMLRETGKRDMATEKKFIDEYCLRMPRTMLRYAIERWPEPMRLRYLKKKT